jgi:hypothetical protein
VRNFSGHPGEISYLLADERLIASGASAARSIGLDLLGSGADGYVSEANLDEVVQEHALIPTAAIDANVILRLVPGDVWSDFLEGQARAPEAAVALDLAEEPDSRSRAAGEELLRRLDSAR